MQKTLLAIAITAAALCAQNPRLVEEKQLHVIGSNAQSASAGTVTFMSAEAGFETSVVKGVPFTGDFITENTQTLADGNRIKNGNTTSYARDGEGRTRREITIGGIGQFTGGESRKTIFIHDPVSKVDYVLDPQGKTARKITLGAMFTQAVPASAAKEGPAVVFNQRFEGPRDEVIEHGVADVVPAQRMPLPPGLMMQGHAGAIVASRTAYLPGTAASPANFKNDALGKRIIEGVEAEGTRTTLTIPAGQIGNDLALDTVSERWYSDELKTVIMTTRKDPRTGESVYKLTNLRRGEPSRQLFELPSDYQLITEDVIGPKFRMRVDKKQE
jgi:hypothetical protein